MILVGIFETPGLLVESRLSIVFCTISSVVVENLNELRFIRFADDKLLKCLSIKSVAWILVAVDDEDNQVKKQLNRSHIPA